MGKFVLTGADGNLGSAAAEFALQIATPDQKLVFTSYKLDAVPAETAARWRSKGAELCAATYDDIESLKKVFEGAEAVAFISTWLIGEGRRKQARNVIEAAKACGVRRVCYTSFVGAGGVGGKEIKSDEDLPFLPRDHHYNEEIIRASGLEYSIQRNYLYIDNIPMLFAPSWKFCGDKWLSNSNGQKGAYVTREDCGRVLGALLLGKGEKNTIYEVTGPEAVTQKEVFDFMCSQTGYKGEFVDMSDEELKKWWLDRGLPLDVYGDFSNLPMKLCIGDLLCCGEMIANLSMSKTTDTVEKLTGRKPTSFTETLLKYKDFFPKP